MSGGLVERHVALLEALRVWPEHPPRDGQAWLATVATRRLVDARRSEASRRRREEVVDAEVVDDFLAHVRGEGPSEAERELVVDGLARVAAEAAAR